MNLIWQPGRTSWYDWQDRAVGKLGEKLMFSDPEDRIIKKVEFGNINMPLSTSLIRGSESLFGLKTEFQLGKNYWDCRAFSTTGGSKKCCSTEWRSIPNF